MFTSLDIKRLVKAAELPDYDDKNLLLRLLNSEERRKLLLTSDNLEEKEIVAAIEVQRRWRGYRTRKILYNILCPSPTSLSYLSSNRSSPTFQDIRTSLNSSPLFEVHSSLSKRISRIQSSYHSYTENLKYQEEKEKKLLSFQGFCALTIQGWWRRIYEKLRARNFRVTDSEVSYISESGVIKHRKLSNSDAANIIQKAWRKHIDIQVFQYYKQLINFRNKGDPQFMLKCINPKEADLLDAAAGIHIRFRLGGVKFPPNIYYKIFTHINVADVGAFSPRNYVDASTKHLPGKFIHNRGLELSEDEATEWYERYENNGWRLVSDRVMNFLNQDPVVYETAKTKIPFNHQKLVRKQDVLSKKKKKKIEWMKKMYASGMLQSREDEGDVNELVEAATKGIFMIADESGVDAIKDWEVDELLQWTKGLNYDSYVEDWTQSGTTATHTDLKGNRTQKDLAAMVEENT